MRRFIIATLVALALQAWALRFLPDFWPPEGFYFGLFYWTPFVDLVALFTRPQGADGLGALFLGTMAVGTVVYSILLGLLAAWFPRLWKRTSKV
jgi:hypothetical protein